MRVLSIDFDYFQKVTKEQLAFYPDGIDHDTELSEIIWGARYATNGENIRKVGIMEDELDKLESLLLETNKDSPVMVANSHIHIYDFIHDHQRDGEQIKLINIDMHHDFINDNPELDCGNWVSHLAKEQMDAGNKIAFNWIANPISLDVYGFETDNILGQLVLPSLDSIKGKKFDAVFLCRSDTWTPPHLDKYFAEVCGIIKDHFDDISMEQGIDKPRTQYLEIEKRCANLAVGKTELAAAAAEARTRMFAPRAAGGKGKKTHKAEQYEYG